MKILSTSSYFWLFITLSGLFRAFSLYFSSTSDLRKANENDHWYTKPRKETIPTKLSHAGLRTTTRMDDSADNIFYFIQVKKKA